VWTRGDRDTLAERSGLCTCDPASRLSHQPASFLPQTHHPTTSTPPFLTLLLAIPTLPSLVSPVESLTDVCLVHARLTSTLIHLALVLDKTSTNEANAEPQVVPSAIAASQFHNRTREDQGFNPLDTMTIPCVTVAHACPTFYLVPVTTTLNVAVITGQYPSAQTQFLWCPTVTTSAAGIGMEDAEYKRLALKRFLPFKALAKSHYEGGAEYKATRGG